VAITDDFHAVHLKADIFQPLESMPDYVFMSLEPYATIDIIEYMELHGLSLLRLNIIDVQN
jgi:hypothetical protein